MDYSLWSALLGIAEDMEYFMAPVVEQFLFGEEKKKPHKMLNVTKTKSWSISQSKEDHIDVSDKYTQQCFGAIIPTSNIRESVCLLCCKLCHL